MNQWSDDFWILYARLSSQYLQNLQIKINSADKQSTWNCCAVCKTQMTIRDGVIAL